MNIELHWYQCDWNDWKTYNYNYMALHLKCPWNQKFGIWIVEMKLSYMKYTNFQIGSQSRWLLFYYQKIYSWKKICLGNHVDLHIKLNLYVNIAKCQMPLELMHEWVDQFATQPMSLFTQKLEITNYFILVYTDFVHFFPCH